jgi:hypothetical protein
VGDDLRQDFEQRFDERPRVVGVLGRRQAAAACSASANHRPRRARAERPIALLRWRARRTGTAPWPESDLRVRLQPEMCGISDQEPVGQRAPALQHRRRGRRDSASRRARGEVRRPLRGLKFGREARRGKPLEVGERRDQ